MKSMKLSPDEQKEYCQPSLCMDPPDYPYGLKINLDPASVAKLGIAKLPEIGQVLLLTARVEVCARSECKDDDDESSVDRTLSIQITDMGLSAYKESGDPAQALFGAKGEAKA
jgi:hypothetical protein